MRGRNQRAQRVAERNVGSMRSVGHEVIYTKLSPTARRFLDEATGAFESRVIAAVFDLLTSDRMVVMLDSNASAAELAAASDLASRVAVDRSAAEWESLSNGDRVTYLVGSDEALSVQPTQSASGT